MNLAPHASPTAHTLDPLALVLSRLGPMQQRGDRWHGNCPAHDDRRPSLSVWRAEDGWVCFKCHAGCSRETIIAQLGLRLQDIGPVGNGGATSRRFVLQSRPTAAPENRPAKPAPAGGGGSNGQTREERSTRRRIVGTYDYRDATGTLILQAVRFDPKQFSQRRPDPDHEGQWLWNLQGIDRDSIPLYRLPEALAGSPADPVFFVEGEKDAEAARSLGLVATCGIGGAQNWHDAWAVQLAGRHVVVIPDNDPPGRVYAEAVARSLVAHAASVRVLDLAAHATDLPGKGDLSDWLALPGTGPHLLLSLAASAPLWRPENPEPSEPSFLPSYPLNVLPPVLEAYAAQAAAAIDCPPEMVAFPMLVFAAAAIGNTRRLIVKQGWTVYASLWGCVVAPPGTAKSPAQRYAKAPLDRLQAAAWDRYKAEEERYRINLGEWESIARKDRDTIAKPSAPTLESYWTTDATKEALHVLLQSSPGIVMHRDEVAGWVLSFDAYRSGKGADRADWLSFWSQESSKVDRKSSAPLYCENPAVSVMGGIQPERLGDLAGEAGTGDGFLDRILWCYPETRPLLFTDDEVSGEIDRAAAALFARLRNRDQSHEVVMLSSAALATFRQWHDTSAVQQADLPPLLRGMAAKLPSQVARLALILHCLWNPDPSESGAHVLEAATMEDAIALAEVHRQHAHKVARHYGADVPAKVAGLAARIVRIIERETEDTSGGITRTDLSKKLGGNVSKPDLDEALAPLIAARTIAEEWQPTAGRPRQVYRSRR